MKNISKYAFIAIIILIVGALRTVHAQNRQSEIGIGDRCPDVLMTNIINYKTGTSKISEFRNKLLILDFWATWCNPCVKAFPKLDSIQKIFAGKIQIMPVTTQDIKTVKMFLDKMSQVLHITPFSVTQDTILNTLFQHTYLPHFVWIDGTDTVRAITTEQEVTVDNIKAMISRENTTLETKNDRVRLLDETQPAFTISNPVIETRSRKLDSVDFCDLLYHSIITKFINGIPGYETISDSTRVTAINESIANLYSVAAGKFQWDLLMPNRQRIELKDSMLYYKVTGQSMSSKQYAEGDEFNNWAKENAVCYELKLPDTMRKQRFDIMLNDLNNCFGSMYNIQGGIEKRETKALVLKRITTEDKLKTNGINKPYVQNTYFYGLYNEPFSYFIGDLRQYYQLNYTLIDETNYNGKVDMELNCNLSDLQQLNRELEKYGLKFIEEEKDIDMIVIKEKPKLN